MEPAPRRRARRVPCGTSAYRATRGRVSAVRSMVPAGHGPGLAPTSGTSRSEISACHSFRRQPKSLGHWRLVPAPVRCRTRSKLDFVQSRPCPRGQRQVGITTSKCRDARHARRQVEHLHGPLPTQAPVPTMASNRASTHWAQGLAVACGAANRVAQSPQVNAD